MSDLRFELEARAHLSAAIGGITRAADDIDRLGRWGSRLAIALTKGGRLLAAGNGGSAAHAQHLTSELVGRYREERVPLSAIALNADSSSVTAVMNDYGPEHVFARQVRAHGRAGDVFVALSTSGRSPNLLLAAHDARAIGMEVWAVTGALPNPLATAAHDVIAVDAARAATVQEVHQVVVHLLCEALEHALAHTMGAIRGARGV